MQSPIEEPLLRIQREISEVVEREEELRKQCNYPNDTGNELHNSTSSNIDTSDALSKSPSPRPRILQRAFSTSVLTFSTNSMAPPKRFSEQQRGIMQRFIKSRGKLLLQSVIPTVRDPIARCWSIDTSTSIKVSILPEKMVRKGYVSVEERIQHELRDIQNREAELRAHRKKTLATSQPNLLNIVNGNDTSPENSRPTTPTLKGARSFLQLCEMEDKQLPNDTVSAPSSLRPAVSLAQLCDVVDESEVPSSSELIAKFESIIQKNLTNGKAGII